MWPRWWISRFIARAGRRCTRSSTMTGASPQASVERSVATGASRVRRRRALTRSRSACLDQAGPDCSLGTTPLRHSRSGNAVHWSPPISKSAEDYAAGFVGRACPSIRTERALNQPPWSPSEVSITRREVSSSLRFTSKSAWPGHPGSDVPARPCQR